jgi:hypothetical protein
MIIYFFTVVTRKIAVEESNFRIILSFIIVVFMNVTPSSFTEGNVLEVWKSLLVLHSGLKICE